MSTLKLGDRFKVKENGITGQIIGERCIHTTGHPSSKEFKVLWDHFSRVAWYPAEGADETWEVLIDSLSVTIKVPGLDQGPTKVDIYRGKAAECYHEAATYTGLIESYEYCKKCDKRLT